MVIVATSSPAVQQQAASIATKGGKINFFAGFPAGKDGVSLKINLIHYEEIFVFETSFQSIYDFQKPSGLLVPGSLTLNV